MPDFLKYDLMFYLILLSYEMPDFLKYDWDVLYVMF